MAKKTESYKDFIIDTTHARRIATAIEGICHAIESEARIRIRMRGEPDFRIVEPCHLRFSGRNNLMVLHCIQVGGYSSSGPIDPDTPPFRNLQVVHIHTVEVGEEFTATHLRSGMEAAGLRSAKS